MTKEEEAHKRIEKALWRIYAPYLTVQIATMAILAVISITCFYKACHL